VFDSVSFNQKGKGAGQVVVDASGGAAIKLCVPEIPEIRVSPKF